MKVRRQPSRKDIRASLRALPATAVDSDRATGSDAALGLDKPERKRSKPRDLEGAEQRALFQWAEIAKKQHSELEYLYHVPNGRLRDKVTAHKLKLEGVKPGVPDIHLDVARHGYHGLRIELKAKGGRVTPVQNEWLDELARQNYAVVVCVGWMAARDVLVRYLANGNL